MMRALYPFVAALSLAACSFDTAGSVPMDAAGGGGEIDAAPADAAPPDAVPVQCTSNDDCQSPPNLCQLPGTCNLDSGHCVFPDKDCTSAGDECNIGTCNAATGECMPQPAFDGSACGDQVVCGEYSECGGFDATDPCDETGTRSRECMDFACSAGACVGSARTEQDSCTRNQDGVTCDDTTCGDYGECEFAAICDETGTQSRDCMQFTCQSATCTSSRVVQQRNCTRPSTDGTPCQDTTCGEFSACSGFTSTCDETGTRVRSCTAFTCEAETCEGTSFTDSAACSRDTDGDVCGSVTDSVCPGPGRCPGMCPGGCRDVCSEFVCEAGSCPVAENGPCPP